MKQKLFLIVLLMPLIWACGSKKVTKTSTADAWKNFHYPEINFVDKAKGTKGSEIYNRIVPNPDSYIKGTISEVLKTLYWSDKDSIPAVRKINYTIEDIDGISAKGGNPPEISIFYSSRWVEKSETNGGDDKVLFETRGVLLHELTHGFQLEPKGVGSYGDGGEFWIFIEGMADAVRIHNGGFPDNNRKIGGSWKDGYQKTGYFLEWLTTKDADFLRKFNKSALDVVPWGFDKALKHVLGQQYSVDGLWNEYQEYLKETAKNS